MTEKRDIELVVFDWDGTLVNSQDVIVNAMSEAFTAHGLPAPPPADVRRLIGLRLVEMLAHLLPPENSSIVEEVRASYSAAFAAAVRSPDFNETLFPGALDVLRTLSGREVLLGLATGKSLRGARASLERHGLTEHFITVQTPDTARGKPHPQMLLQAMDEAGAKPATTLMVGDTVFDIEMARHAGAHAVGVTWGYHEADALRSAGARAVLTRFEELLDYVG